MYNKISRANIRKKKIISIYCVDLLLTLHTRIRDKVRCGKTTTEKLLGRPIARLSCTTIVSDVVRGRLNEWKKIDLVSAVRRGNPDENIYNGQISAFTSMNLCISFFFFRLFLIFYRALFRIGYLKTKIDSTCWMLIWNFVQCSPSLSTIKNSSKRYALALRQRIDKHIYIFHVFMIILSYFLVLFFLFYLFPIQWR